MKARSRFLTRLTVTTAVAAMATALGADAAAAQGTPNVTDGLVKGRVGLVFAGAKDPEVFDPGNGGFWIFDNASNIVTTTSSRCFVHNSWLVVCDSQPQLIQISPAHGANEIDVSGSPVASVVYAGAEPDTVLATPYGDEVDGGSDDDGLYGMSGGDTIYGAQGVDRIWGGDDTDHLEGGPGDDHLYGGDGNDFLDGDDYARVGGFGSDVIDGGAGRDDVLYRWRTTRVVVTLDGNRDDGEDGEFDWVKNVEEVEGGYGPDFLQGDANSNTIAGRAGDDEIRGAAGDDALYGHWGGDTIVGGQGKDLFIAGDDADLIDSRDGVAEQVGCGPGADRVIADALDVFPASDCEFVDWGQRQTIRFVEDPRSVAEGDVGPDAATFALSLPTPSSAARTISWSVSAGTATPPADFQMTSGTVAVAPWATTSSFEVRIAGDTLDEPDETFEVEVQLLDAANTLLDEARQQVTIADDDREPAVAVDDPTTDEAGKLGPTMTFTVSLSEPSAKTVTVEYETRDSTAGSELKSPDYDAARDSVTFSPGETAKQLDVTVHDDLVPEADETFDLALVGAVDATLGKDVGTGTILDDDFPFARIDDVSVAERPGSSTAVFTVALSEPSGRAITVDYMTADSTALAGVDYRAIARTTVAFAPGQSAKQLNVTVDDDSVDEHPETFQVVLVGALGAQIGDGSGIATIADDDPEPSLSVSSPIVAEGDSGPTNVQFTISLSSVSGRPVTVDYGTVDGSASAPSDYGAGNGSLTFDPGETSKTVALSVVGDTTGEPHEDFFLTLRNPVFATIATNGRAMILNDD